MIPDEIKLPGQVSAAELVTDRRGSRIWKVTLDGERTVALKYATDNTAEQGVQTDARLLAAREASVLAHLDHDGYLHASGDTDLGTWLAVSWIEAPTLAQRWRGFRESGGPSDRALALTATRQAAGLLANLHERGWRHADLQPDHILIPDDGPGHLIDFALAQGPDSAAVEPAVIYRGALAHLTAPEVAQEILSTNADHHIELTNEAEVYTLGAVLFAAWSKQWPTNYATDNPRQLTLPQIHTRISDQGSRRATPDGWPFMAQIIASMLNHDPAQRPTAAEVASTLTDEIGWRT
jgi:serine/threonine protein kinase